MVGRLGTVLGDLTAPSPRRAAAAAILAMALLWPTVSSGGAGGATPPPRTVWLCQPGHTPDPCAFPLAATSVSANGTATPVPAPAAATSKFDCFYVYPTVSLQTASNANLQVQRAEIVAAVDQAAPFSPVCQVWAPMYRQRTVSSLAKGLGNDPAADEVAYQSLLSGWKDYLAHDNHGRPVIFIGHSQGAAMLVRLLHNVIDPSARLRGLMVSAIILGGNVQVPIGRTVGGSFDHIPTCGSATQTGCVIAYSSFASAPVKGAYFGRPGQGVSLQSGQKATKGQQVACVNPTDFSASPGALQPRFLSATSPVRGVTVPTKWVLFPGLYTATCESARGATWLQVTPTSVPGDPRPLVTYTDGPLWGYHFSDVNLALGNLVADVASEEAHYG
jgi:hypothetical protein